MGLEMSSVAEKNLRLRRQRVIVSGREARIRAAKALTVVMTHSMIAKPDE